MRSVEAAKVRTGDVLVNLGRVVESSLFEVVDPYPDRHLIRAVDATNENRTTQLIVPPDHVLVVE